MNGNLLWTGIKSQALDVSGKLRLNLRKGMYLVKTKTSQKHPLITRNF